MKARMLTTTFTGGGEGTYEQNVLFQEELKSQENQVINLYPEISYEEFEGFGGAVTEAAGYVYSLMNKEQKRTVIETYFGKEQMGYRLVRVPMDSCDFSLEPYEAVSVPEDRDFSTFSFERTERYILPMLRDIQKVAGGKLELMLSPWSPPAFMKDTGIRQRGGRLKKEYYQTYAEYLCRYIKEFEKRGFPVKRMSLQNEQNAIQTWDSCQYTAAEEKEFLKTAMYPALQANGLSHVEIYLWDHNKERLFERACEILDEETLPMVAGVAFHWYSGDHFDTLRLFKERFPEKKLLLSESCLEYSVFGRENVNKGIFALIHEILGDLNSGMCMFHDWNLCLDEEGGPNYVGNFCHAPYLFHRGKKRLLKQPTQSCFWHFSHHLLPGSRRIACSSYTDRVELAVYQRKDGSQVVFLMNKTSEQLPVFFRENGKLAKVMLLPESLSTCIIEEWE